MRQKIVTCKEFDQIDFTPTVIFGFYQSERKTNFTEYYTILRKRFPNAEIIGCSSESNIYDALPHLDVHGEHLCVYMCLDMKKEALRFEILDLENDFCLEIEEKKEYGAVILSSQYSPDMELFVRELPEKLGTKKIFGAIASCYDLACKEAEVFYNGSYYHHHMLLWMIDQNYYCLDGKSMHYFRPVGFELEVTEVKGNTLYMLNNRPALEVLEEMIGELLDETIESFNHPFFIIEGKHRTSSCSVPLCSIRAIDREMQSIELYRHLFLKDKLKVGIALSRTEKDALLKKFHQLSRDNSAAMLFNCIGIKKNLGMMEYLYLIDLKKHLNIPIIGFHSFGEIGSMERNEDPILHNQTMSIAVISEKEDVPCS